MDSRWRFLHRWIGRLTQAGCRGGPGATRRGSFKLVGRHSNPVSLTEKRARGHGFGHARVPDTWTAAKGLPGSCSTPVPQTDTGGLVEQTEADERTLVKELGKMIPYLRKKGCSLACTPLAGQASWEPQ